MMTFQDFNKMLKQNEIKSFYLFYGEEEYLKDYCVKALKAKLLNDDFNYIKLEGKIKSSDLSDICDEMPMMGSKKIVLVKNSGFFSSKGNANEDFSFLNFIPEYTCLIFKEDEVDKRCKAYKVCDSASSAFEFTRQDESMIGKILTKAANQSNRQINLNAIHLMIMGIGDDIIRLLNELDKLIKYTNEGEVITDDHVKTVCELSVSSRIFDLTDALSERNTEKAFKSLMYLLDNREAPQMIIVMIARQFLMLYDAKSILEEGGSQRDIVASLGVRDFVAKKLINQCRGYTKESLKQRFEYCVKMDENIKNGLIKDITALELIVSV